jgi:hypothetical protein
MTTIDIRSIPVGIERIAYGPGAGRDDVPSIPVILRDNSSALCADRLINSLDSVGSGLSARDLWREALALPAITQVSSRVPYELALIATVLRPVSWVICSVSLNVSICTRRTSHRTSVFFCATRSLFAANGDNSCRNATYHCSFCVYRFVSWYWCSSC